MNLIRGIYEVAVRVKDLSRAEKFYCGVLGLKVGLRDEKRRWLFLRTEGNAGMLVLQEDPGPWPTQHFAFKGEVADLERAKAFLQKEGIDVEGPVPLDWIPAVSLYFRDPDGHDLEVCALLP